MNLYEYLLTEKHYSQADAISAEIRYDYSLPLDTKTKTDIKDYFTNYLGLNFEI